MTSKELFYAVLDKFQEQYGFEIKRPYNDSYIEIYKDDNMVGCMMPDGYNLLYNLKTLCDILDFELL